MLRIKRCKRTKVESKSQLPSSLKEEILDAKELKWKANRNVHYFALIAALDAKELKLKANHNTGLMLAIGDLDAK